MLCTKSPIDSVLELLDAMDVLINEAQAIEEQRSELRVPFFRPLSITSEGGKPRPAFGRDLSPAGIGLMHAYELEPGLFTVEIPLEGRAPMRLQTKIAWCKPSGPEWHLSGGRILRVVDGNK